METYKPPPSDDEMVQAFVMRKWGFRLPDSQANRIVAIIANGRMRHLAAMIGPETPKPPPPDVEQTE